MSLEPTLCVAYEAKYLTVTSFPLSLLLVVPALRGNRKHVHVCLRTHTHKAFSSEIFIGVLQGLDSSDKASEKYLKV